PNQLGQFLAWDTETGERRDSGKSGYSLAVAFSPGGDVLARSEERPHPELQQTWISSIEVSEGPPWNSPRSLDGHDAEVVQLAFSLDGKTLASASHDQTVRVWETATGKPLATFHDEGAVLTVAVAPDGMRFASGGEDGVVKVWATAQPQARVLCPGGSG